MVFLTLILLPFLLQGNTGVLLGLLLVSFVVLVALITVLSGIGVAEHGGISSGGVYSMISSVLGGQMGGTVGLLYVFGQVRHLTCSFASVSLHFLICLGEEWGKTAHG
jgi:potassium/chloride transporter 8